MHFDILKALRKKLCIYYICTPPPRIQNVSYINTIIIQNIKEIKSKVNVPTIKQQTFPSLPTLRWKYQTKSRKGLVKNLHLCQSTKHRQTLSKVGLAWEGVP